MPTYEVTNDEGVTLELTGKQPPTKEQLDKIFAEQKTLQAQAVPAEETPEEEYRPTEEELVKDPKWIQAAKTVYKLNEGPDAIKLNSDEQYADYGLRYMGNFNYNLTKGGWEAWQLKDATDEQKAAFVDLMDMYDAKKVSVAGFGRALKGLATDPTTYFGPYIFGKKAASEALKQAIKEGIKQGTKEGLKQGAKWGSIEGSIYATTDNIIRQNARINAGAQQNFDYGEAAKASAFGAAIGLGVGGPLGAYSGKVRAKAHQALETEKAAKAAERQKKLEERTGVLTRPDVGITLRETPEAPRSEMKFYSAGKLLKNELSSPSDLEIRVTKGKKLGKFVIKEEAGEYVPYKIIDKDKKQGIDAVEKTEQGFAKRFGTPEDAADAIENATQADLLPPSLRPTKEPKVRRAMDIFKKKIAEDAPEEIRLLVPQMIAKRKRKDSFGKPYGEARPTEVPALAYRARAGEGFREEDEIMEALTEGGYISDYNMDEAIGVLQRNDVEPLQRATYDAWKMGEEGKQQTIKELQAYGYNPYRIKTDEGVEKAFKEIQTRVVPDVEPPTIPVGGPSYRLADLPEGPPLSAYADDLEKVAGEKQQKVDITEELARRVGAEETNYSRPLAERARENIANTMPDIQADINIGLNKRAVDVGVEILDELNIPRNPTIQISDQIFNAIEMIDRIPKYRDVFQDILKRNNIKDMLEFANLMKIGVSDSARIMQQYSQAAKKLGPVIDEINELPRDNVSSTLQRKFGDTIHALDNIRRGLMVATIETAQRNIAAQFGRLGFESLTKAYENALNATFNPMRKMFGVDEAPVDHTQAFRTLMDLTIDRKKSKQVAKLLDYFPKQKDRMFSNYASDVKAGTKVSAFEGAQKVVNALNILNRMQDYFFRTGVFSATLTDTLRARGVDINDVIARNDFSQIKKSDIEKAVDNSLYFTYAKTPDNKIARDFVDNVNAAPFTLTGLIPFPRFMANAIQFQYRYSPLGALSLLKPDEIRKIARGDVKKLSQAMVGTAVLMAAVEWKRRGGGGEKWYEIKGTDGTTIDMRPYFPLTPYFLVADLIVRAESGRIPPTAKDMLQGLTGAQFRAGAGLAIVDDFVNDLLGAGTNKELAARTTQRFISNVLSAYTRPFRMFGDFIDQQQKFRTALPEEQSFAALPRNVAEELARGIPGLREAYPMAESPTRAAAPGRPEEVRIPYTSIKVPGPLAKQLTGITVREAKNPAEKELDRLGFKRRDILPYTGDKIIDEANAKYMGPMVEQIIGNLVQSEQYLSLNNEAKELYLRKVLKAINQEIKGPAMLENPERYAKVYLRRLPKYIRKLASNEINYLQKMLREKEKQRLQEIQE